MAVWGSGGLPPEKNFLEANCLKCRKMPFLKIGEMEGIQYEGQVLPFYLPLMDKGRGGSCPYCPPRVGVPVCTLLLMMTIVQICELAILLKTPEID